MISSKHNYMKRQMAVGRRYADIENSLASKPAERYRWEQELPELVECAKMIAGSTFAARDVREMRTTVVNKKISKYDIYIGRGSKWGNPFHMKGSMNEVKSYSNTKNTHEKSSRRRS